MALFDRKVHLNIWFLLSLSISTQLPSVNKHVPNTCPLTSNNQKWAEKIPVNLLLKL